MKSFYFIFSLCLLFPIEKIEILSYHAEFKNIGAGTAVMKTTTLDDKKEILFSFKANKIIDFFYKLHETILMVINRQNHFLEYINHNSQQGKRIKNHEAYFDYSNNKIFSKSYTTNLNKKLYNSISIITFLRNQKLTINDRYIFDTYNFGKIKKIGMKVVNQENIVLNNKTYHCFVLAPFYFNATDEKNKKGNIKLWISKKEQLPIIIEQTASFGEIILTLNTIQHEH